MPSLRVCRAANLAAHEIAGVGLDASDPRLAMVVEGIVRSRGTRPRRQAAAAVPGMACSGRRLSRPNLTYQLTHGFCG